MPDDTIYEETQRLHHNAIVRYVVPMTTVFYVGITLAVMLAKGASGQDIAILLAIGLGVPLAIAWLAMHTTVTVNGLHIRTLLAFKKSVSTSAITHAEAIRYSPLADCGGWGGPRRSRKFGVVYNMAGDRGVLVRYDDHGRERSMVIGSRRSEELERALRLAADLPEPGSEHVTPPNEVAGDS
ncbi:MAG: hypothetical protein AAFV77_11725 [Planctomycetota bacterium]